MFAVVGYRYILQAALAAVRRQIAEPETEHIAAFLCVLPDNPPWSERRIVRVREPAWQQCWAVQIGRYMAFLPLVGDTTLYERIAAIGRDSGEQATVHGDVFYWPDRPYFGID